MAADDDADMAFLQARIAAVEAQIVAIEEEISALNTGIQSYELSTGQTTQRVTKVDLLRLINALDALMNRRQTLRALLCGGSTRVTPAF